MPAAPSPQPTRHRDGVHGLSPGVGTPSTGSAGSWPPCLFAPQSRWRGAGNPPHLYLAHSPAERACWWEGKVGVLLRSAEIQGIRTVRRGREDGDRVRRQDIGITQTELVRLDFLVWREICTHTFSTPSRNNVRLIDGLKVGSHPSPQPRRGGAPLGGRRGDSTGPTGSPVHAATYFPSCDIRVLLHGHLLFGGPVFGVLV